MSLSCLAAQLCAVQALMGKTRADDNVRDSETGLIAIDADGNIQTGADKPFINVWSDDLTGDDSRNDLMGSAMLVQTFEFGVTGAMPIVTPDGQFLIDADTEEVIVAPHEKVSDAKLNIILEAIDRQIRIALSSDDKWAVCWRDFMCGSYSVVSRRGGNDKKGVRFAARQLQITAELAAEPSYGGAIPPNGRWARFFACIEGTQLAHLQPMFESLMGVGDPLYDFDDAIQRYALRPAHADALGVTPFHPTEPDATIVSDDAEVTLEEPEDPDAV